MNNPSLSFDKFFNYLLLEQDFERILLFVPKRFFVNLNAFFVISNALFLFLFHKR